MKQEDFSLHEYYYFDYPFLQKGVKFRFMGGTTFMSDGPAYQEVTFKPEEYPLKAKKA